MKLILVSLLVAAVASAPQGYHYQQSKPAAGIGPVGGGNAAAGGAAAGGAGAAGGAAAGGHAGGGHAGGAAAGAGGAGAAGGAAAAKGPAVQIVHDERVSPDDTGAYSFTFESSDGASRKETGTAGAAGAVSQQGEFGYTLPDGQKFSLTFVADEHGYQPQSPNIPPLPQFVLDQIDFAKSHPEPAAAAGGAAGGAAAGAAGGAAAGGAHAGGAAAGGATAGGAHAGGPPSQSYLISKK